PPRSSVSRPPRSFGAAAIRSAVSPIRAPAIRRRPRAIGHGDRLVRSILAGGIAAPAFDAEILVDPRLRHIVEIEILPVGDVRHREADDVARRAETALGEEALEA